MRFFASILCLIILQIGSFAYASSDKYFDKEYLPKYRDVEVALRHSDWETADYLIQKHFPGKHKVPRVHLYEAVSAYHKKGSVHERLSNASSHIIKAFDLGKVLFKRTRVDDEVSVATFSNEAMEGDHDYFKELLDTLYSTAITLDPDSKHAQIITGAALSTQNASLAPRYCEVCEKNNEHPQVFQGHCRIMIMARAFPYHHQLLSTSYPGGIRVFYDTTTGFQNYIIGNHGDPPRHNVEQDWVPDTNSIGDYLTLIHEAVHTRNNQLQGENYDTYAYHLSFEEEYIVERKPTMSGYKLVYKMPDSLQSLIGDVFDFYFNDPHGEMVTMRYGIYGMMDELGAYGAETMAMADILQKRDLYSFKPDERREIGVYMSEQIRRYYDFAIPLAYYLKYMQESQPKMYADIRSSMQLRKALATMVTNYQDAIDALNEIFHQRRHYQDKSDLYVYERLKWHYDRMKLGMVIDEFTGVSRGHQQVRSGTPTGKVDKGKK